MAFSCKKNGEVIYSFQYDLKYWIALKEDKESDFRMTCCDSQAILKTSKLGTQFFSHKRKPKDVNCSASGETPEHIHIKYLVSRALYENGWDVQLEKRGKTPSGEGWIADIYAENGNAKIVIEVQWSPQTYIETKRRQDKYTQSGVRCAWLLRSGSTKARDAITGDYTYSTKEMPVFSIYRNVRDDNKNFMVYNVYSLDDEIESRSCEPVKPVTLELTEFIGKLSAGDIRFTPKYSPEAKLFLEVGRLPCWDCSVKTNIVITANFSWSVFGIENDYTTSSLMLHQCNLNTIKMINENFAQDYNFSFIRKRYSKTARESYFANSCKNCGALMGRHFILSWAYSGERTKSITIKNTEQCMQPKEDFNTGKWLLRGS